MLLIILITSPTFSQRTQSSPSAGTLIDTENLLKDLKNYIQFINSSVSIFGDKKDREIYRKSIEYYMTGKTYYLRYNTSYAYNLLKKAEIMLHRLYGLIYKKELSYTRELLNDIAKEVIHKDDVIAKGYLKKAYNLYKNSLLKEITGRNLPNKLISIKLSKLEDALKLIKNSRRFAFLALIKINNKSRFSLKLKDFFLIKKKIEEYSPKDKKSLYINLHYSNYYMIPEKTENLMEKYIENPKLESTEFIPPELFYDSP